MYGYHNVFVNVWDFLWLMASITWGLLWYNWYRSGFALPDG